MVRIRVSSYGVVCLVLSPPRLPAPFQRRGLERAFCRRGAHPTVVSLGGRHRHSFFIGAEIGKRLGGGACSRVGVWACEMYTTLTTLH